MTSSGSRLGHFERYAGRPRGSSSPMCLSLKSFYFSPDYVYPPQCFYCYSSIPRQGSSPLESHFTAVLSLLLPCVSRHQLCKTSTKIMCTRFDAMHAWIRHARQDNTILINKNMYSEYYIIPGQGCTPPPVTCNACYLCVLW